MHCGDSYQYRCDIDAIALAPRRIASCKPSRKQMSWDACGLAHIRFGALVVNRYPLRCCVPPDWHATGLLPSTPSPNGNRRERIPGRGHAAFASIASSVSRCHLHPKQPLSSFRRRLARWRECEQGGRRLAPSGTQGLPATSSAEDVCSEPAGDEEALLISVLIRLHTSPDKGCRASDELLATTHCET